MVGWLASAVIGGCGGGETEAPPAARTGACDLIDATQLSAIVGREVQNNVAANTPPQRRECHFLVGGHNLSVQYSGAPHGAEMYRGMESRGDAVPGTEAGAYFVSGSRLFLFRHGEASAAVEVASEIGADASWTDPLGRAIVPHL